MSLGFTVKQNHRFGDMVWLNLEHECNINLSIWTNILDGKNNAIYIFIVSSSNSFLNCVALLTGAVLRKVPS